MHSELALADAEIREKLLRPQFLLIDDDILPNWRPLESVADISSLPLPSSAYQFRRTDARSDVDSGVALDIARTHSGRFDYVLAECAGAFLWHCLFRLSGDRTPFVIVPRYNCVHAMDAYALLLSSQLCGPQDILFCGSHTASRAFGMYEFRCSPSYVPGIDLDLFRPLPIERAKIRASLGSSNHRDMLLYVGRMAADKNIPELLRVFEIVREYRDAELIVCFHFPQKDYLRQCMALADSVEGVRFVQEPSKHALVHWYNAADLFVSTAVSIFETFGRAPVEAMACGTPPVVSAYNGFRDTVAVDSGFLVPTISDEYRKQPDVRCFAETIVEALENRSDLKLKAQKGVAQAQRFDRNYCGRTILQEMEGARKGVYKNSAHR